MSAVGNVMVCELQQTFGFRPFLVAFCLLITNTTLLVVYLDCAVAPSNLQTPMSSAGLLCILALRVGESVSPFF